MNCNNSTDSRNINISGNSKVTFGDDRSSRIYSSASATLKPKPAGLQMGSGKMGSGILVDLER